MAARSIAEAVAHQSLRRARMPFHAHFWNVRDGGADVFRTGRLTPQVVDGLIRDGLRLGSRGRVDLELGTEPDAASLDWLEEELERLHARGVKVRIRVSPTPERGRDAEPLDVSVPGGSRLDLHRRRVIVAEDDDDQRRFLSATLRASQLDVVEASDGASLLVTLQGVAWTGQRAFDAVVTDVDMPDLSGIEVLRALKGPAQRVPAVLVTAYDSEAIRAEAFSIGIRAVLPKPLDPDELRATVSGLIAAA